MTYDEYWHGDPWLAEAYRKAHIIKLEQNNYLAWWQAAYFHEALSVVSFNENRKKGVKAKQYPKEPHRITPLTEAEKEAKVKKEREKAIAYFTNFGKSFNKEKEGG